MQCHQSDNSMRQPAQRPSKSSLSLWAFLQTVGEKAEEKAQVEHLMRHLLCNGSHRNNHDDNHAEGKEL